jgi:2-polyprenyl-6-hydroxyphenyl methylase/3-demethylubiquinone-9 3-methyltransferase
MSTVLKAEIEKFSKDAPNWWDENGPFKPLHRLNPARMGYIRAQIGGMPRA